jgi:hypothetical protein
MRLCDNIANCGKRGQRARNPAEDDFALRRPFRLEASVEAEETAKPTEVVWGIRIATWEMSFESTSFPFEYPMLTQAVEISIDSRSMTLEVRPRETDTRFEMDAFVACQIIGAADIKRSGREHLARQNDRPVSPFDPGSYADVLKLAATNLDSEGAYQEVLASGDSNLVVTDSWMLFPAAERTTTSWRTWHDYRPRFAAVVNYRPDRWRSSHRPQTNLSSLSRSTSEEFQAVVAQVKARDPKDGGRRKARFPSANMPTARLYLSTSSGLTFDIIGARIQR